MASSRRDTVYTLYNQSPFIPVFISCLSFLLIKFWVWTLIFRKWLHLHSSWFKSIRKSSEKNPVLFHCHSLSQLVSSINHLLLGDYFIWLGRVRTHAVPGARDGVMITIATFYCDSVGRTEPTVGRVDIQI